MILEQGEGEGIGMLEIATKSWDAATTFPESVRKQEPGQASWASWGMIQGEGSI